MPSSPEIHFQAAAMFEAALRARFGVIINTNSSRKAKAALYEARKYLGSADYAKIQVRFGLNDPEHEVWLIKAEGKGHGLKPSVPLTIDLGEL